MKNENITINFDVDPDVIFACNNASTIIYLESILKRAKKKRLRDDKLVNLKVEKRKKNTRNHKLVEVSDYASISNMVSYLKRSLALRQDELVSLKLSVIGELKRLNDNKSVSTYIDEEWVNSLLNDKTLTLTNLELFKFSLVETFQEYYIDKDTSNYDEKMYNQFDKMYQQASNLIEFIQNN